MSSARYENTNANAAIIGTDPENSWLAAIDGEEPTVWPVPLMYQGKDSASKSAERFLENRPDKLLCSDDVVYTLDGNRIWRPLSDQELAAEVRATDPTTDLDVNKIYLMVKAIKLARFTKARPLSWIDKPPGAPEPNDLILASNGIFDLKTGVLIRTRAAISQRRCRSGIMTLKRHARCGWRSLGSGYTHPSTPHCRSSWAIC